MAILVAVLIVVLVVRDQQISTRDIEWIAGGPPRSDIESRVYTTYLKRHNYGRLVGGLIGIAIGLVVILRWGEDSISVGFGIPMPGNLLVWWLSGVVVGSVMMETYRLHRSASQSVRTAILQSRPPRPLPSIVFVARILTGLTVVIAVIAAILGDTNGCGGALFAVIIVGVAELTQHAITNRAQPVSERALHIDTRLRWFAGSSTAWLGLAGACLGFMSLTSIDLSTHFPILASSWLMGVVTILRGLGMAVGIIITVVAIIKSRMRPPRQWIPEGLNQALPVNGPYR